MAQKLGVLGVELNDPLSTTSGVDVSPRALRCANIHKVLKQCSGKNGALFDYGEITLETLERIQYYQAQKLTKSMLFSILQRTSDAVDKIITHRQIPIVLGGDMLMSLGTVDGLANHFQKLGMICFDAHLNLYEDEAEADIFSKMKQSMRRVQSGKIVDGLEGYFKLKYKISSSRMVFIGARDYSRKEILTAREENIRIYSIMDVEEMGISRIIDETIDYLVDCDGVHFSFDFDCMDAEGMPGIVNHVSMGLTSKEVMVAMNLLYQTGLITSTEFYGIDSCKDYNNQTAKMAVELIGALFGSKSL